MQFDLSLYLQNYRTDSNILSTLSMCESAEWVKFPTSADTIKSIGASRLFRSQWSNRFHGADRNTNKHCALLQNHRGKKNNSFTFSTGNKHFGWTRPLRPLSLKASKAAAPFISVFSLAWHNNGRLLCNNMQQAVGGSFITSLRKTPLSPLPSPAASSSNVYPPKLPKTIV